MREEEWWPHSPVWMSVRSSRPSSVDTHHRATSFGPAVEVRIDDAVALGAASDTLSLGIIFGEGSADEEVFDLFDLVDTVLLG